MLSNFW